MDMPQEFGSKNELLISNSFIITLFGGLLCEFSIEEVREFWLELPLKINGVQLSEKDKYEHMWDATQWTPLEYVCRIMNSIEPFCLRKGRNYLDFIQEKCAHTLICEPKNYLKMVCVLMNALQQVSDLPIALLKHMFMLNRILSPKSTLELLGVKTDATGKLGAGILFAPDKTFTANVMQPECYSSFRLFLQNMPCRFGLQKYDTVNVEAEILSVNEMVDTNYNPEIRNGDFYIDGEVFGTTLCFHDYLREKEVTSKRIKPPDREVVLINKDYFCPRRNRTVLLKDCVYGAPVYLLTVHHQYSKKDIVNPMRKIIKTSLDEHHHLWMTVEKKYHILLTSLKPKLNVIFKRNVCGIHFNDKFITSGIQARILREILWIYVNEGITEFERRHFTSIPELVSTILDTGFNTRLNRISSILDNVSAGIRIVKKSRGKFYLDATTNIEYKEV